MTEKYRDQKLNLYPKIVLKKVNNCVEHKKTKKKNADKSQKQKWNVMKDNPQVLRFNEFLSELNKKISPKQSTVANNILKHHLKSPGPRRIPRSLNGNGNEDSSSDCEILPSITEFAGPRRIPRCSITTEPEPTSSESENSTIIAVKNKSKTSRKRKHNDTNNSPEVPTIIKKKKRSLNTQHIENVEKELKVILERTPVKDGKEIISSSNRNEKHDIMSLPPMQEASRSKMIHVTEYFGYVDIVLAMTAAKIKKPFSRHAQLLSYNFLTEKTIIELASALKSAQQNKTVKAVLISSLGPIFCSGLDPWMLLCIEEDKLADLTSAIRKLMQCLMSFNKPLVCAIQGPAVGFGASLALHCDMVYASETASFQWPYIHQGTPPNGGASFLLHRHLPRNLANSLLLNGSVLTAEKAHCHGFVNDVFIPDSFRRHVFACMNRLMKSPAKHLSSMKNLTSESKSELKSAIEKECEIFSTYFKSTKFTTKTLQSYIKNHLI